MRWPDLGPLRVAVTGTKGQLARSLCERAAGCGVEVVTLGRPAFDLTRPAAVGAALRELDAHAIVNAAAYTAVDKAESEPGLALEINAAGAGAVAQATAALGLPMIQLSTDYVFDGTDERPYREDDPAAPLGAYGRSKLAGEQAVAAATADHVILRTSWVYSPFGTNFVRTMLRLATTRDEIAVVADQRGSPTSALDLADAILAIVRTLTAHPDDAALRGVFHATGTGETTWAALAERVFAASAAAGGPVAAVRPIPTAAYPTPARRPPNSRLDGAKLERLYGLKLPPWPASVERVVARLLREGRS